MSIQYTRLPGEEPAEDNVPVFDFSSIHNHNYPKYFSYSNTEHRDTKRYKSIFTYSGGSMLEPDIPIVEEAPLIAAICAYVVTILCYILLVVTLPVSCICCLKNVQQHEKYVIFRLGRLLKAKGPGLVVILPCIDRWTKVDLRMRAFSVPPQVILTVDGGGVEIGAEVFYRVKDPVQCIKSVQDLTNSCRILAHSTLSRQIVKQTLNAVETERNKISDLLVGDLNSTILKWGAEVSKVELSQLKVLQQPQEQSMFGGDNPLSVLGPMLFPPGSNIPFQQLAQMGQQFTQQMSAPGGPGAASELSDVQRRAHQAQPGPEAMLAAMGIQLPSMQTGQKLGKLVEVDETPEGFEEVSFSDIPDGFQPKKDLRTPDDLIEAVKPKLGPDLVREFGYIYKFVVSGTNGGTFYLDLKNGCGDVGRGEPPAGMSSVTLSMTSDVLASLLTSETSAFGAYMSGSLLVDGDLSAAQSLGNLIESIQ